MDNKSLYHDLYDRWKEGHPGMSGIAVQQQCNAFWKSNKSDQAVIVSKIAELKSKTLKRKSAHLDFFRKSSVKSTPHLTSSNEHTLPVPSAEPVPGPLNPNPQTKSGLKQPYAQKKTEKEINTINEKILSLSAIKKTGLASSEQITQLKIQEEQKTKLEKKLNKLKKYAKRQEKFREQKKMKIEKLKEKHPHLLQELSVLSTSPTSGRPRLEDSQSDLLDAIVQIIRSCGGASDRR